MDIASLVGKPISCRIKHHDVHYGIIIRDNGTYFILQNNIVGANCNEKYKQEHCLKYSWSICN